MSVVRKRNDPRYAGATEVLVVTDDTGDELVIDRLSPGGEWVALVTGTATGLSHDDTLEVLSFLADCAGVERLVPGGAS